MSVYVNEIRLLFRSSAGEKKTKELAHDFQKWTQILNIVGMRQ